MIYIATDNFNDGFPLSNAYDDTIYQKANGEYYLKFRFPVDRLGVWKHLICETVLKADDTRGLQLFKIKKINKVNGYIRVFAKHISDDLNFIAVDKIAVNNATGRRVMEALAGSTTEQHSFIFSSDIATMHTLNLSNTTAGKVLSKDKHSIIGQWGGELIRDNFLVDLKARAGVDTEILFMNKKNVKNLDNVVSTENLTTRLKLIVEKEHEGKKQTVTATVDSPNINAYPRVYTNYLKVTNNNITTQEELIEYGKKYFRDKLIDFPTNNLTVNVIDKNQEQVRLFDTVWFRNVDFNIDKRLKVVAYEYSPMAKRYKKISFGALKVSNLSQIKSLSQLEDKIEEKVSESFVDAFKIQKNLSELLKLDRKGIEDKLVELEEKSKGALEVKKALFEADGTIPDVVKAKILDAVEGDIGRLKTIITEAELIKAIQAKLNFAEIKNALIDKAFINQIISDEKFTQQFEDGEVTTQNIFTKLKDSIKSNISKEFVTKDGVKKLVNDLTIDADGIRQITQQESEKVFEKKKAELKGTNSYIHKKYSDFADGRNMSDNSTLKYIGIYTGDKEQAPTNASEYSWTKIRGEDGVNGIPGTKGADGRTPYFHTAYSNSATGDRDFSTTNSTGKEYIGTYSDFEVADSADYRKYKWVKIKGEDGHTLTADLRFEGTYINNITNNVKAYLDVFYDGKKVDSGFEVKLKDKGGTRTDWSDFWNSNVNNGLLTINSIWANNIQNGQPLELIALVTYKGLNTIANARLDNLPDTTEIKEITKKYKTFESTIDQFNSTIGEVKQQVLANEEKRNLILGSRMLSDKDYKKLGNTVELDLHQEYQGLPYLSVFQIGKTSNVWQGVGFDLSLTRINKGETYSIRIPMFVSESQRPDEGSYLEIKNHDTREILWKTRLDTNKYPIGSWNTHEYTFTASKDMNISKSSFWIFHAKNGYLAFAKPYMCEGDTLPKNYSPAPEDFYLQNSRIESSIIQTKNEIDLKVSKDNVIASINASVEKNEKGQNQGVVKIKGEVLADNIHGKTFTGSKFKIGQYGFLQPIEKGLQINAPENFGSKRGIGLQIAGEGVGLKENGVPPGLFIYEDPDFTKGATIPSAVNRVLLTVAGMACFSTRVLGSVIKGQPILTNLDNTFPFSNIAPVKFIGYREGGFMHFYGINNTNTDKWLIKVDQWGSDRKLKTDIKESKFNAIEFVEKLKFKDHGWNKDEVGYERPHTKCGLIAQELQELDKSLVVDYGKYLGLDGLRLINISLKAIQELSTENQQLKSQLKEMNERLRKLEDKINGNL